MEREEVEYVERCPDSDSEYDEVGTSGYKTKILYSSDQEITVPIDT